jgi:formyltetrahydrofolate synthetase
LAKLTLGFERRLSEKTDTHYIGVSAVSPTPGEGKSATAIGLTMALRRLRHRAIFAEP